MTSPIPSRQGSFTSPPPASPRRPSGLGLGASQSAEQRRARREQFRSFYGLKGGTAEEGEVETGASSRTGDPLDIDSTAFTAPAYYDDLIKKSSLAELMQTASTLLADVNNLQSSRHSLVYNHHHQLFAAGDTISHLNSRTPQLISIMTSLQDSFSSISQLVDSVALPEKGNDVSNPNPDDALRIQLERVRLMFTAEMDGDAIRAAWSEVVADQVEDEDLRREVQAIQDRIDALPPSIEITETI